MATTPVWALPYPAEPDPADVPVDIKKLCDALEAALTSLKSGGSIPGEVKMWPGSALPTRATYGHWVWADGTPYATATYPLAAAAIAGAWRTALGAADPGGGQFRVPDMRGVTPVGLDAMPGGARANRIARAAAAVLAAFTGEETHALATAEMTSHGHNVNDPTHGHGVNDPQHSHTLRGSQVIGTNTAYTTAPYNDNYGTDPVGARTNGAPTGITIAAVGTGVTIAANGGGGGHENLQPSVFVPYICKLDD